MKITDFYMKVDVEGKEFSALELEKIIYESIEKVMGRDLKFPKDDVVVTHIEYYSKD